MTAQQKARLLATLLTEEELQHLDSYWPLRARASQLMPSGDAWRNWIINAGRGWGKSATGVNTVNMLVRAGEYKSIAIVGRTPHEAENKMIYSPNGLLAASQPDCMPVFNASKKTLRWPNGAEGFLLSGSNPEAPRGLNLDFGWLDEMCAWAYPEKSFDNIAFACRIQGKTLPPRMLITTTPKPIRFFRELCADPFSIVVNGSTYDNKANLSASFIREIEKKYGNSKTGRQEIFAQFLESVAGSVCTWEQMEACQYQLPIGKDGREEFPNLDRVVVAIDPAVSNNEGSDETGIVVAGKSAGMAFVLDDVSLKGSPSQWANAAINAYRKHKADCIVVEVNNGGDMCESVLRMCDPLAKIVKVHASRGKITRAEPVSVLYQSGLVKHVKRMPELETQLCSYTGDGKEKSPDRMDALVWALSSLFDVARVPERIPMSFA